MVRPTPFPFPKSVRQLFSLSLCTIFSYPHPIFPGGFRSPSPLKFVQFYSNQRGVAPLPSTDQAVRACPSGAAAQNLKLCVVWLYHGRFIMPSCFFNGTPSFRAIISRHQYYNRSSGIFVKILREKGKRISRKAAKHAKNMEKSGF